MIGYCSGICIDYDNYCFIDSEHINIIIIIIIETLSDLWTSTVTDFISLPDSIATDWVSDCHGGLVQETVVQVTVREANAKVSAAAVTPQSGRGKPRY